MSDSKTLSTLFFEQNELIRELMENGGEITDEIQSRLNHLDLAIPEKVDRYFHVLERMEHEANYFKIRAEEMAIAAKVISSARDRLKDHLKGRMVQAGKSEIEGQDYKFNLVRSKPKVVISEESLIPREYTKTKTEVVVEKTRIAEDLAMGVPVPGAHLEEVQSLRSSVNKSISKKLKGA